jgi:hypothetical protein
MLMATWMDVKSWNKRFAGTQIEASLGTVSCQALYSDGRDWTRGQTWINRSGKKKEKYEGNEGGERQLEGGTIHFHG